MQYLASFFRLLPIFFDQHPKTPLRAFYIILVDYYLQRFHQSNLNTIQKKKISLAVDFAAELNKAVDKKKFSYQRYINIIRKYKSEFGEINILRKYRDNVLEIEGERPNYNAELNTIRNYRESVIRAGINATLSETILSNNFQAKEKLVNLAMQCQLIDDLIDAKVDQQMKLPSLRSL